MKLDAILKETFNVDPAKLTDESTLMGFAEWDSMTHMLFITKLEEVYNMELTGDEIVGMRKVGDIRNIISSRGKEL